MTRLNYLTELHFDEPLNHLQFWVWKKLSKSLVLYNFFFFKITRSTNKIRLKLELKKIEIVTKGAYY